MYATTHRTHGDPAQPYVAMTHDEAAKLAAALDVAVTNMYWIANHTPRMPGRRSANEAADTLATFRREHCAAHGLPS